MTNEFLGTPSLRFKQYHFEVRDDIVQSVNNQAMNMSSSTLAPLGSSIEPFKVDRDGNVQDLHLLPRPRDAAHYWNPGNCRKAFLRCAVSNGLLAMPERFNTTRPLSLLADIVGNRAHLGRVNPQHEYVRSMLEHKIVIVAQRDTYQDHYRLFEALVSGALVMSDPMVGFPYGIEHNESIVVYKSITDMQDKVMYYLENEKERLRIAQAGREVALRHHRVAHRWYDLLLNPWEPRDENGVSYLLGGGSR